MSKKRPVMSHDPLAELDAEVSEMPLSGRQSAQVAEQLAAGDGPVEEPTADDVVIPLESCLTIVEAEALHERLLRHVRTMTPISLDASQVDVIDTAGLQLLAATFKTASAKGVAVFLRSPSPTLVQAARRVGLDSVLGVGATATSD